MRRRVPSRGHLLDDPCDDVIPGSRSNKTAPLATYVTSSSRHVRHPTRVPPWSGKKRPIITISPNSPFVISIAAINARNRINATTRQITGNRIDQWIAPSEPPPRRLDEQARRTSHRPTRGRPAKGALAPAWLLHFGSAQVPRRPHSRALAEPSPAPGVRQPRDSRGGSETAGEPARSDHPIVALALARCEGVQMTKAIADDLHAFRAKGGSLESRDARADDEQLATELRRGEFEGPTSSARPVAGAGRAAAVAGRD